MSVLVISKLVFSYWLFTVKPNLVEISSQRSYLISSEPVNVTCVVGGSVPSPVITWWKRNVKLLPYALANSSLSNGSSISVLRLVPSSEDNGMFLTCKAFNAHYPDDSLQDRIQLSVRCQYFSLLFISDLQTRITNNRSIHAPLLLWNYTLHPEVKLKNIYYIYIYINVLYHWTASSCQN